MRKNQTNAKNYDFLNSVKTIRRTGLNTLLAGAGMSVEQALAHNAIWAKALVSMAADKALRNEEDELFLLLCALA